MARTYNGKYKKLSQYLASEGNGNVCLPFIQIEHILGFDLPHSARTHQAWWANQPKGQSLAWRSVGYRTTALILDEERVSFVIESIENDPSLEPSAQWFETKLTIKEAKDRLADTFGVDPSQIEITIRA